MTQAVPRPAQSVLRKIAGNGGWWLAERLGMLGLTLLTSVIVVRSLGPSGYGELSYVLALVGLLAPVVQFGVSGLVARGLLERPDDEAAVLRAALAMRFAGAATALAIGLAWWFLFEPRPGDRWIVLVLLAAQMATSFQVVESWFQVHFRASELVPWRAGVIVSAALAKIAAAVTTGDPRAVALVFALEYFALGVASLLALRRAGGPRFEAGESSGWLRWFAVRSPWLLASGVAEVIYLRIDIVLLERLRGVEEAGTYAVAARLSEVWYMVPVALMGAVFPVLWSRRADPVAYAQSLQSSLDALFAMAFVLALIVQLVGGPLVDLLFGERFAASTPVLQIHIWAGVFIFMRALLSRWLLAEDLLRFSLVTHMAGAVMNIVLNLLLIPNHGATGAAFATVASYACAGWLALFLTERTRPMGRAMARALVLPFRWRDLNGYLSFARRLQ
jgi:PST family polysaccharide transporter